MASFSSPSLSPGFVFDFGICFCICFLLSLLIGNDLRAQGIFNASPRISQSSFSLPLRLHIQHESGFALLHQNRAFHLDHQHNQYLWHSNTRSNLSFISEISYFSYDRNSLSVGLGRNYLTDLDLTNNVELVSLSVYYNQLTTINITNNNAIKFMRYIKTNILLHFIIIFIIKKFL